jgi:hypothetical protein
MKKRRKITNPTRLKFELSLESYNYNRLLEIKAVQSGLFVPFDGHLEVDLYT